MEKFEFNYKLQRLSDDRLSFQVVDSQKLFKKPLKLNKNENISINLTGLPDGEYMLSTQALSDQEDNNVWGKRKSLLFTIEKGRVAEGWKNNYVASSGPAIDINGQVSPVLIPITDESYGVEADSSTTSTTSNDTISTQSTVTLSGAWQYTVSDGSYAKKAVRNAYVEVKYRDNFYIWRTIATTYTNASGNWSVSYTPPTNANLWQVNVYSKTTYANVTNNGNSTYMSYTQYLDLSSGGNIGTWIVSTGAIEVGFWVYDEFVTFKTFMSYYKDPGSVNRINWDPVNTAGSYQSGSYIYFNQNAPGTSETFHEMAHLGMYNVYGSTMPSGTCPSPHYVDQAYNAGCAWKEGWANFIPLVIKSTHIYTYPSGGITNYESETSGFASGDKCEGRVAAALWDVYDSTNDGLDTRNYSFTSIYKAMWDGGLKADFSAWWTKWKDLGYDENAKYSLQQNSINYS